MVNTMVGTQALFGKVALVTGKARSRGASVVTRLAANGAAVALTYGGPCERPAGEVQAIVGAGGTALAIQADPSDVAAMESAVEQAVRELGRLDILVNHIGMTVARPTETAMPKNLHHAVAVGARELSIALLVSLPYLKEGGRIINICSIESEFSSSGAAVTYSLARAAVAGLSQSLARDLCTSGITINTIMPSHGCRDTDAKSRDLLLNTDAKSGDLLRNTRKRIVQQHHAGPEDIGQHHAGTDDIAHLVAFLAMPGTRFFAERSGP